MKSIFNLYNAFLFIFAILLGYLLLPYYHGGYFVLGQEGNIFLDFSIYLHNYLYTWQNNSTGFINYSVNSFFPSILILYAIQNLVKNPQVLNFILVFSIYFFPFFIINRLCRYLHVPVIYSFLISLFYVFNPFTSYFISSNLNLWNLSSLFTIPLMFLLILKYYDHNQKLFFICGFASLITAFNYLNPPLIAINHIAILFSILFAALYWKNRPDIKSVIQKYGLVIASFFLFNLWWILSWFYFFGEINSGYSSSNALSWLHTKPFIPIIWKTFNLTTLMRYPPDPQYDNFNEFYTLLESPYMLIIPFILLTILLLKKGLKKYETFTLFVLLISAFFIKGTNGLFGKFYEYLIIHLPLFSIFKTPAEKWGVIFIFLLTLFFIFQFKKAKNTCFYFFLLILFAVYDIYISIPFLSSDFIPDIRFNNIITVSHNFKDKPEYQSSRKIINEEPETSRVLAFPGSENYQVALAKEDGKFYTGMDPILHNLNKPFITAYNLNNASKSLFDDISSESYFQLLGIYNLKKILINKDMYPWFGFQEKENIRELEQIFDKYLPSNKNKTIDIYDAGQYFLPRFYIPDKVTYSPVNSSNELLDILKTGNYSLRSAAYLGIISQSITNQKTWVGNKIIKENSDSTVLIGNLQSAIDMPKLKLGIEGLNPRGVLFPYVRWRPYTLFYPFITQKEEKNKNTHLSDSKDMIEQRLFYAAKRISELEKWVKTFNDKEYSSILKNYREEMTNALSDLKVLIGKGDVDTYPLLLKIGVSFEAHQNRLLDVLNGSYSSNNHYQIDLAKKTFQELNKGIEEIINRNYQLNEYHFTLEEGGSYEILGETAKINTSWQINKILPNSIIKKIGSAQVVPGEKYWLSFGKVELSQGDHLFYFQSPPPINYFTGNWEKIENKAEVGKNNKIVSFKNTPLLYKEITNLQPGKVYALSYEYWIKGDSYKIYCRELKKDDTEINQEIFQIPSNENKLTSILINKELTATAKWTKYKEQIETSADFKKLEIYIYPSYSAPELSQIQLRNISLEEIIQPKMVLRKNNFKKFFSPPEIIFKKINPTKYLVDINNAADPYLLVFSESFHSGWKAYISKQDGKDQGKKAIAEYFGGSIKEKPSDNSFIDRKSLETFRLKPLSENSHIIINGYANSWYIQPQDVNYKSNYRIIIEYWPQKLFYFGMIFSCAIVLFSLIIIFRHHKTYDKK